MMPFDPNPADSEKTPERQGSEAPAHPHARVKEHIENIGVAPSTSGPSASADGEDALPPCWQGASAHELLLYGPAAARFETPPPENAAPAEPEEQVGEALTARQLAFCERYVERPVAKYAARDAGYSDATAAKQASRLLKHPLVIRRILELRRKRHLEEAYRRETLMDKLDVVFGEAVERREFYAAIQALTMQARLAGFAEAMPGARYLPPAATAREQIIWDAVNRLEQKLSEIDLGDYAGAGAIRASAAAAVTSAGQRPIPADVGRSRSN